MKNYITVENFIKVHRSDIVEIMSPGGFVTIAPDSKITELYAHAGVSGTEMAISWDEIKGQVIDLDSCNFNEAEGRWYVLSRLLRQAELSETDDFSQVPTMQI